MQSLTDCLIKQIVNPLLVTEPKFHLGWMHIYINFFRIDLNLECNKRITMLHRKIFVSIFNRFCKNTVPYITPVDKIIFKISISTVNHWLSQISGQPYTIFFKFQWDQIVRNFPSVNVVNDIFHLPVPGSMQLYLSIVDKPERNIRMRKGKSGQQITDMACLCHRRLQEFASGRCIEKQLTHQKGRPIRRSGLLRRSSFSAFYDIFCPKYVFSCLCDQFHSCNCRNTRQRFSAEPKRRQMCQILCTADFAGRMAQKCIFHVLFRDPTTIIRNSYQRNPALFNLHSHRCRSCVNRIFHQLFHNRSRAFNHFPGCYLINCNLIQQFYMRHSILLSFLLWISLPSVPQLILQLIQFVHGIHWRHMADIQFL